MFKRGVIKRLVTSAVFIGTLLVSSTLSKTLEERIEPNELGKIMILEYHNFSDKEERWTRSYENFKNDLGTLYKEGYRLVNIDDIIKDNINVTKGFKPVVLTFDDSSENQFRLKDNKLDENSAVGIMHEFYKKHHDFGFTGTFYIIQPPFGKTGDWKEKLSVLKNLGFDIGNHTINHSDLSKIKPEKIPEVITKAIIEWKKALGNDFTTNSLALPFGVIPKSDLANKLIVEGNFNGIQYKNEMILLVGSGPSLSPYHINYNPERVPRIQVITKDFDKNVYFDKFIEYFRKNPKEYFISDGNPDTITIPKNLSRYLNEKAKKRKVIEY